VFNAVVFFGLLAVVPTVDCADEVLSGLFLTHFLVAVSSLCISVDNVIVKNMVPAKVKFVVERFFFFMRINLRQIFGGSACSWEVNNFAVAIGK